MENLDSFTIAVVIGVLVVLGIFVALVLLDRGGPPSDAAKPGRTRPS